MSARAFFEPIKTLGFAGISPAYAAVGAVTTHKIASFCITNATEGDLYFTTNSARDEMFVAKGTYKLYDVQSNINSQFDDKKVFPVGTQFYVKQITAPVSGSVYIECLY
jgi:hypothetical protein